MKDVTPQSELLEMFWNRLDDVPAGMLSAPDARPCPMAPLARRDDDAIWFITSDGTDIAKAAKTPGPATFLTACAKANLYSHIEGEMHLVDDAQKLDELWSPFAAAWFKGGKRDDDIRLVRFTPTTAEIWATEGSTKFLYEIAKANLTDSVAEGGEHGTIQF